MKIYYAILIIIILNIGTIKNEYLGLCESKIYCVGDFLHTIQMAEIFNDSKTFVDMPSKFNNIEILNKFSKLNPKNKSNLKKFLDENFYSNGQEVVKVEPTDWMPEPNYINNIKDVKLRNFSIDLNLKWKKLLKKFDQSKICEDCESSAVFTSHSFIVPGGRFIEYYYWDTYWVVEGLLISGMTETVKGIIENFFDILETNGFVPNGARVYYLNRSQPPLLTQMVHSYLKHTNNIEFLRNKIHLLDKEYEFWMKNKSIEIKKNNKKFLLNQYRVESDFPRPESYKEDFINAQESGNPSKYYSNVLSAAESGYDFSSRWFENPMDIKTILIDKIIPIDLNSIIYQNEKIMHEFHKLLGNEDKSKIYKSFFEARHEAINNIFWDPDLKTYGDYNFELDKIHSDNLYITDLAPLWFDVKAPLDDNIIIKRYESILFDYVSGIPTSNINTHQQWDFPNVWAPYHHWMVSYFVRSKKFDDALNIANRFVNTVYCGWKKSGNIYEKYNAEKQGEYGQGGEYVVQEGFGWTNGVAMLFLNEFGPKLESSCDLNFENKTNSKFYFNYAILIINFFNLILFLGK